jgi:hypothetical protein
MYRLPEVVHIGHPKGTLVRFQVLMVMSMKMAVFWDIAPCSLVHTDRRFRGTYCFHDQGIPYRRPLKGVGLYIYIYIILYGICLWPNPTPV